MSRQFMNGIIQSVDNLSDQLLKKGVTKHDLRIIEEEIQPENGQNLSLILNFQSPENTSVIIQCEENLWTKLADGIAPNMVQLGVINESVMEILEEFHNMLKGEIEKNFEKTMEIKIENSRFDKEGVIPLKSVEYNGYVGPLKLFIYFKNS